MSQPRPLDSRSVLQLRLIGEVAHVLGTARIRFWLRGGWALDFLIGDVTRPHADIDLVTWTRHGGLVRRVLAENEYRVVEDQGRTAVEFTKADQYVGIVFIQRERGGRIVTPGLEWDYPWPEGAFPNRLYVVHDIACRTMAPEALLAEKETYAAHRGPALRPKDLVSIAKLRELLEI